MAYNEKQIIKGIKVLLLLQLSIIFIIAGAVNFLLGAGNVPSAILGGLVAFIPYVLFISIVFSQYGAQNSRGIVRAFYLGEAIKIFATILLLCLVFVFTKVNPKVFFLTYIALLMSHWLAPLLKINYSSGFKCD